MRRIVANTCNYNATNDNARIISYKFDYYENRLLIYDSVLYFEYKKNFNDDFYTDIKLQLFLGMQSIAIIRNILHQIKQSGQVDTARITLDECVHMFSFSEILDILNELIKRKFILENSLNIINESGTTVLDCSKYLLEITDAGIAFLRKTQNVKWSEGGSKDLIESYIKIAETELTEKQ